MKHIAIKGQVTSGVLALSSNQTPIVIDCWRLYLLSHNWLCCFYNYL